VAQRPCVGGAGSIAFTAAVCRPEIPASGSLTRRHRRRDPPSETGLDGSRHRIAILKGEGLSAALFFRWVSYSSIASRVDLCVPQIPGLDFVGPDGTKSLRWRLLVPIYGPCSTSS
jgi:hypothetical protein